MFNFLINIYENFFVYMLLDIIYFWENVDIVFLMGGRFYCFDGRYVNIIIKLIIINIIIIYFGFNKVERGYF